MSSRDLPVSLPSKLVEQRPDIRAAEANLQSASAQIRVAVANRLPNITLSGGIGSTALAVELEPLWAAEKFPAKQKYRDAEPMPMCANRRIADSRQLPSDVSDVPVTDIIRYCAPERASSGTHA